MANPKLSVLLSAYNAEKYIRKAVESILNQTFTDFELLIADDRSTDTTRSVIDSFSGDSRVRILHNEVNQGKTATINRLFQQSLGEYITIHDADDMSLENRFAKQMNMLYSNSDLIMCGCSFMSFSDGGFGAEGIMDDDYGRIQKHILTESQFHGPTMIFKKAVIEDQLNGELLRPFFEDYNEDCDLAMRLIEHGRCVNSREVLYNYRIRPDSLSKTITPRKKSLYPLLVQFHHQRTVEGADSLQRGNIDEANKILENILRKNYSDESKIFRESAQFLMYYDLKREAIKSAWRAVFVSPLKWINWGTLQYCVRKYLVS